MPDKRPLLIKTTDNFWQPITIVNNNGEEIDFEKGIDVTAKYNISRSDDAITTEYYGFIDTKGLWYILQIDTTTGIYLYINGTTDFLTNWAGRAGLSYDEFDTLTW